MMLNWFKHKTELQKLQHSYCKLIKCSYEIALKDREKSEQIRKEADKILLRIRELEDKTKIEDKSSLHIN
ncbi:Lacal_2735 family protein [Aquimarina algicola]|uniref:Lacal_2735 family protein n=1 Tax=Aquimarina algicola TaxID=2589995 RepID=A0A504J2I8_9FLAO|nr:Lacal_2735 family protein [Aquimarina algicola]